MDPVFFRLICLRNVFMALWGIFLFIPIFQESAQAAPSKPMSYQEIVSLVKPQWQSLSPAGSQLAFCTRYGCLEENRNIDTLFLFHYAKNRQEKLYEADEILQANWRNKTLHYLVREGQYYKIMAHSKKGETLLLGSSDPVSLFTLSPDGSQVFYTVTKSSEDDLVQKRIEEGYVYRHGQDFAPFLSQNNYRHKEWEEIHCLTLSSGKSHLVTRLPYGNWLDHLGSFISSIEVSEDGNFLLMGVHKIGQPDVGGTPFASEVVVWDKVQGSMYNPLTDSIMHALTPCWLDEQKFIFQQRSDLFCSVWLFDAKSHVGLQLDWLNISESIKKFHFDNATKRLYAICAHSLYRILLEDKIVEKMELPATVKNIQSLDQHVRRLSFIAESSNEPPEVILYDCVDKQEMKVTCLNPQLADMALGKVERIKIETDSGISSIGYLVHPVDEKPGTRYPMIIATYGFRGSFIADAEWHSSFPAQTLAGNGYLILLLNCTSGSGQSMVGNPDQARKIEGWDQLELFESAVDLLSEMGIGDPEKVGIYGWSHGGFVVNFLISHSQKFHVACLGEGGDYNPGGFWLGGHTMWPKIYDNMFGGPPWGTTLKNYLEFSPFFQVDKIRTPLLMEYSEGFDTGFEMYTPLRYLGVPAELVVYEGEEHNFVRPRARVASMARKLEWFDFWFFNKQWEGSDKKEQYQRWNAMREEAFRRGVMPSKT